MTSATQQMSSTTLPWSVRALETLERYLPAGVDELASQPIEVLESRDNPGIGIFKSAGGAGMLVPSDYGGGGASAREAVEIQYALGLLAPSTAVGLTMHQFTVATLVEMMRETGGLEGLVLESIAAQNLLVASAFAEGKPGGHVLDPTVTLVADGPNYRVNGVKKPCSLTASMDMITASVKMPDPSEQFAVALFGATDDGVRTEPFWNSPVLAGSETEALVFDNVLIPEAGLTYVAPSSELDRVQVRGYVWFELCIAAAYVGIAAAFVQRLPEERTDDAGRVAMATELGSSVAMLDSIAARLDSGEGEPDLLADCLTIRYSVERAIQRATDVAMELLGVERLSQCPELGLLFTASRALSYHPPSRRRTQGGLADWVRGGKLTV
jgi:hypothetical protein